MIPRGLILVAVALPLAAAPAGAQTVAGSVAEAGSGEPVEGAIVTLLDPRGDERGAVLTGSDGGYEVRAPRPGRYRLRIERIGYRTVETRSFDLVDGERTTRRVEVPVEAVEIAALEVAVEDRCETRPDAAEALGVVWGEARKALEATRLTRRERPRRFEIVRTERLIDPETRFVLEERAVAEESRGRSPFRTRPADEIAAEGWATVAAQEVRYYGPDAESLLSDDFLDRHCFRLVRRDDRIGLGFEPVGRGTRVEIRGILWIDPESRELRSLEFGYVGLPYERMEALARGRIEFRRLEDGRWVVERWRLRAPEIELRGGEPLVVAIVESVGEVRR